MEKHHLSFLILGVFLVLGTAAPTFGQWTTQTFLLEPGWNAVFFEVQPEPNRCSRVFEGLPVESVWMWNRQFSSVQFIQDANLLVPEQPEWLKYFRGMPQVTSLFSIQGGRAYLIKLGGDQSINWEVTGRAVIKPIDWMANSLNLAGFGIDPSAPPSIQAFFAPSTAHAGKPVYKLNTSGRWQKITTPSTEKIQAGRAYWVYCEGQSTYQGPLMVTVEQAGAINFGRVLTEQTFRLKNAGTSSRQITINKLPSEEPPDLSLPLLAGDVPLSWWNTGTLHWANMAGALQFTLPAGGELAVRLSVRRKDMPPFSPPAGSSALYQNIFSISDGAGSRLLVPVVARGLSSQSTQGLSTKGIGVQDESTDERAGLWVGTAVVNKVSYPSDPSPPLRDDPVPAASEFPMRLIVHVDASGKARLLQQVLLMWQQGTTRPDPEDPWKQIVDEPGRYVLVTDDALISQFSGAAVRDGKVVGRRISSAAFTFSDPKAMTGNFGGVLECNLVTGYNDAKNPFKHKYHPDHDNLDYDFQTVLPKGRESYTIERHITLSFSAVDPQGLDIPGWGDNQMGGTYGEIIQGVHKEALWVEGSFRLNHVSRIPVLNDGL